MLASRRTITHLPLTRQYKARAGVPAIGSNGVIQGTAYTSTLNSIYSRLALTYPEGRPVKNKVPADFPPLPDGKKADTKLNVPSGKGRCSLIDMDTARAFARGALGIGQGPKRRRGRVVIEAFPGPGAVTRALLELPRSEVKRVIVLEEELKYLNLLKELEYFDDRVHVIPQSAFVWETYEQIKGLGLMDDVHVEDWKEPHSELSFIGHLPLGPVGEQLIAQLLRTIPERAWLYKYGRMRMSWLLASRMEERIQTLPGTSARCKLTVVAEATASLTPTIPDEMLADYNAVFYPKAEALVGGKSKTPVPRRIGQPFVSRNFDPLAEGFILPRSDAKESALTNVRLDKWDYVLRQLFILKSTPLEKSIQNLGPGASSLLNKLTGPDVPEEKRVNIKARVNSLTIQELARVVEEFDRWPFAPNVLFITDQLEKDR